MLLISVNLYKIISFFRANILPFIKILCINNIEYSKIFFIYLNQQKIKKNKKIIYFY